MSLLETFLVIVVKTECMTASKVTGIWIIIYFHLNDCIKVQYVCCVDAMMSKKFFMRTV